MNNHEILIQYAYILEFFLRLIFIAFSLEILKIEIFVFKPITLIIISVCVEREYYDLFWLILALLSLLFTYSRNKFVIMSIQMIIMILNVIEDENDCFLRCQEFCV